MRTLHLALALAVTVPVMNFACSATKRSSLTDDADDPSGAGPGGGGIDLTTTNSTSSGTNCTTDPNLDDDGDGFSESTGDCNDCDANSGPGAVEVPTVPGGPTSDEDCDGQVDEVETCDQGLAPGDADPLNAAKAIELCQKSDGTSWGVVSASYVRAGGGPASPGLGAGLLPAFGTAGKPQAGSSLLVLSSGNARDASAPDACGSMTCNTSGQGAPPPGFPQDVAGCLGGTDINDDVALEVALKAPQNAKAYSFDFAFMSFEYAEWVCTDFNDQFIALVTPPPMGAINGNISFDSKKNPVSVNIALFDHCDPALKSTFGEFCVFGGGACPAAPSPYCPNGAGFMAGTGFNEWGDSGSTGWLATTAPVNPGEQFSIRFAIWDTGDAALDSTVLIDNFRWTADPGNIGTTPVDDPK